MKLRNKKTGEIIELLAKPSFVKRENDFLQGKVNTFNSLAELNEEWEDYKELEYWYIDDNGDILLSDLDDDELWKDLAEQRKQIGNYFETKEQAEKAVEKLKALTEAKKDGLKIKGYYYNHEDLVILADIGKCNKLTLDTLFGKEID